MSTDTLRAMLPDIGDSLAAAMQTLHDDHEPFRCEEMAARLHGAARHVLRLREGLMLQTADVGDGAP